MTDLLTLEHEAVGAAGQLPALLASAETLANALRAGAHGRKRSGPGETFWQYRDYAPHDPAAMIDWRQSARSPNRIFVRETEWETAATVRFWCGGQSSLDYASGDCPTKRQRAQVLSVATALLLSRAGENIGTLPPHERGRSGNQAVMEFAETVLNEAPNDGLPPPPPPGTSHAVYVSDFYISTEQLIAALNIIAGTGVPAHLVMVYDPSEESFSFQGRTLFEMPRADGNRPTNLVGDAAAIASAYRMRRTTHIETVRDVCRRYGFTLLLHSTERPALPTLTSLHAAIGGHI